MKYLILLGDGMADWPIAELDNKTPLEYAKTPNMDKIANGLFGMIKTVPDGLPPGSDVANLSVLGYNPEKYYTGRAPLEAASNSIFMEDADVAYRCNFVNIENGIMKDFAAGHIPSQKAAELIDLLNSQLDIEGIEFFKGVSYRNLMIWRDGSTDKTTPPHDISDKPITDYLPQGKAKEFLLDIMNKAQKILKNNSVHKDANSIWLWGEGKKPSMPLFRDMFNKNGCMISAVDLMVGIGKLTKLEIPEIKGLTGFIDTNYEGKINAAYDFLKSGGDFAYVHVEATDEAGHMGELNTKIEAIELFDEKIVKEALKMTDEFSDNFRIAVLPDHPTPIKIKTHTSEPIPFAMFDTSKEVADNKASYNEKFCKNGIFIEKGYTFIKDFLFK
jgi:2,3-bisphosphoglycerate-independent phosphoglycerate mutase